MTSFDSYWTCPLFEDFDRKEFLQKQVGCRTFRSWHDYAVDLVAHLSISDARNQD